MHGAGGRSNDAGQASRLSPSPSAGLRSFHNEDRSKSIEAAFVSFNPVSGVVRVRLGHGGIRDIPILSLSTEDREYVKQQAAGVE